MENILEHYFNTSSPGGDYVEDLQLNFTDWHRAHLKDPVSAEIACLLEILQEPFGNGTFEGPYCNTSWDGLYCWPATPVNHLVEKPCSDLLLTNSLLLDGTTVQGTAFRFCSNDTTWIQDGFTNYSVCIQELMTAFSKVSHKISLETVLPYVLFVGCMLSIICLISFIMINGCCKSTFSFRGLILLHIMAALLGKSVLWIVIVGPTIFPNFFDYRSLDWTCNVVFSLHFYTLLVTAFWMVVLAHYLNQKLTKKHCLRDKFPWVQYMLFSWVLPAVLVILWATLMVTFEEIACWINYTKSRLFWVISFPLVGAFLVNFVYLINILRVFVKRISLVRSPSQQKQIRNAKRDIVILFPVLGINHLLFLYNPGGEIGKYYMFFHAVFQSVQGILVSLLCCYLSSNVRKSFWKRVRSCCYRDERCHTNGLNSTHVPAMIPGMQRKRVSFAEDL